MNHRFAEGYSVPLLTKTEYATLKWLADRGYDAGILRAAGVAEEYEDGSVLLGSIPEHRAWAIRDAIEDDPHAFLTSSGSHGLNVKLIQFVESIV